MVRLVKGAYWDGEIKRAQEGGLAGYPVFTHKEHTDISYLACARALIAHADVIYPQFATHNAGTIAAILQMARAKNAAFEMQRLHGMGEGIYREVMKDRDGAVPRVRAGGRAPRPAGLPRAPAAGERRQLELRAPAGRRRGRRRAPARLADDHAPARRRSRCRRTSTRSDHGLQRRNSHRRRPRRDRRARAAGRRRRATVVPAIREATADDVSATMVRLDDGFAAWNERPVDERAAIIRRAGDLLDARLRRVLRPAGEGGAQDAGRLRGRGARGGRLLPLLRRPGADPPAGPGAARPHRRKQRAAHERAWRVRLHLAVELPAGHLRRPGRGRAGGRQHRRRQAGRTDAGRRRAHGRPAARGRRTEGRAGAAARPRRDDRRRADRQPAHRGRLLHRLHAGGQDHPARARRTRTAPSCRSSPRPAASTR